MEGLSDWVSSAGSSRLGPPGWVCPAVSTRLGLPGSVSPAGFARFGQPDWVHPARVMYDLKLRNVITSSSELRFGVLRLYGKPIESRLHSYFCGGHWTIKAISAGRLGLVSHV